eukprot:GEMP01033164.1.p1 GENE.GEMP01033164.1~~GEMP01033164.1.p1  ORF type:complete len:579 (-),score=135.11 GEMP01033164.1:205-1941(-)
MTDDGQQCADVPGWALQIDLSGWASGSHDFRERKPLPSLPFPYCLGSMVVVLFVAMNMGIFAAETGRESLNRGICLLEGTLNSCRANLDMTAVQLPDANLPPSINSIIARAESIDQRRVELVQTLETANALSAHPFVFLRAEQISGALASAQTSLDEAYQLHLLLGALKAVRARMAPSGHRVTVLRAYVEEIYNFLQDVDITQFQTLFRTSQLADGSRVWSSTTCGMTVIIIAAAIMLRMVRASHSAYVAPDSEDVVPRVTRKLRLSLMLWTTLWLVVLSLGLLATILLYMQHFITAACAYGNRTRTGTGFGPNNAFYAPPHLPAVKYCLTKQHATLVEALDAMAFPHDPFLQILLSLPDRYNTQATVMDPVLLHPLRSAISDADFVFVCDGQVFPLDALPALEHIDLHCASKKVANALPQFNQLGILSDYSTKLSRAGQDYEQFALSMNDNRAVFTWDLPREIAPVINAHRAWADIFSCEKLHNKISTAFSALCEKGSINSMVLIGAMSFWALGLCAFYVGNLAYSIWRQERRPLEQWWSRESRSKGPDHADINEKEYVVFPRKVAVEPELAVMSGF